MSQELSALNLGDDFEKALACEDASRWKLEKIGPLEVLVSLSPVGQPHEVFQARLLWTLYPGQPPSLKFRDPATERLDMPTAWPQVRGFRPTSLDACVSWCMEGFNLHPEWRNDPKFRWDPRGNVLLKVLRILQDELDNYFRGRFCR
ncbi:MAG: hypothetical protein L0Z62_45015 [Gemmataceae bacterium]|nr:hypothetical protein [Gemmataceae bacterium]